jgi:Cu(I)/Ag(I) efflux system membrane fusion protein
MSELRTLRRLALSLGLILLAGALLSGCSRGATPGPDAVKYQCPMHPTYVSDRPGDCPICGMRLVPIEKKVATSAKITYTCPMHPAVFSQSPGKCPECGMDLVPVRNGGQTPPKQAAGPTRPKEGAPPAPAGQRRVLYYRSPMDPRVTSPVPAKDSMGMDFVPVYADQIAPVTGVPGMAPVEITANGLRLSGIQTAPALSQRLIRTIRTVGTVMADETRIHHIHTKIPGWVEGLSVNFTGQMVRRGEPVLSLYSPELLASQEEFLRARQTAARFAGSDLPEVRKGGEDLVRAARQRLQLFDVPESLIAELEQTGKPQRTVALVAPISGFVTAKATFEGQQVEPGMELFTITDLSRVWIEADFYEYEAQALKLGQIGRLTLAYDPQKTLTGRVMYLYPTLNPDSRTLRARFEFPNPGFALKPGMYANVELDVGSGLGIVIPESAVIDTGERQVVFVALEGNLFEPRLVIVGARNEGRAQVLSGVAAGERVVVRANFLLDSESRLRAAIAAVPAPAPRKPGGERP